MTLPQSNQFYEWTSECVGEGHPDKLADQISDSILDACLSQDPKSRVACETLVKDKTVVLAGEITTKAEFDKEQVVKGALLSAGYDYNPHVISILSQQSPQIQHAVDCSVDGMDTGAGDQGVMFGFASLDTKNYMPLSLQLSRELCDMLKIIRENLANYQLGSDCKTQVTLKVPSAYSIEPKKISRVVMSVQHGNSTDLEDLRKCLKKSAIRYLVHRGYEQHLTPDIEWLINASGAWTLGGPEADSGLTGRKIIVDNYGSDCPVGGGAFSGKDPTKVDRTGAYATRHIAKNIIANSMVKGANCVMVQVSYVIGQAKPCSFRIKFNDNTFDKSNDRLIRKLEEKVLKEVDLRPRAIIERFNLESPIYHVTAQRGHFGFDSYEQDGLEFYPWEKLDLVL
jgi:S-adenosylmethionine synthetase